MRVASTTCHFDRHLQIFAPPCPHMPGGSCCKQLHHMRGYGRAVVAMHGRNGRSSSMRFEVHSALPMLLLHFSGANDCATGGTGLVQTQDDRWVPTFGVVRAHRQYGEARRVSRGQRKVEINTRSRNGGAPRMRRSAAPKVAGTNYATTIAT